MNKFPYIDSHKADWAIEFSTMLGVEYQHVHNGFVKLSCYTLAYHIADNFRNGELRDEILEFLSRSSLDFILSTSGDVE